MPEANKRRKAHFGSEFEKFPSMAAGPVFSGLWPISVEVHGGGSPFTLCGVAFTSELKHSHPAGRIVRTRK